MTLVTGGDCDGAIAAVYVTGDEEMFDLVLSQCAIAVSQELRWAEEHSPSSELPWADLPIIKPESAEPGDRDPAPKG